MQLCSVQSAVMATQLRAPQARRTTIFGWMKAGTVLDFCIHVRDTTDLFYSGAATRNSDGLVHAALANVVGGVAIGFEDVMGGGDRDFDDVRFMVDNASVVSVPDSTNPMAALGIGFMAVALARCFTSWRAIVVRSA